MASATNPNTGIENLAKQTGDLANASEKEKSRPSSTDKDQIEKQKLNQSDASTSVKKDQKPEISAQQKIDKEDKGASSKTEVKDEKGHTKSGEEIKHKNSDVKVPSTENELKKQKTLVDDKNPSQTVLYDKESMNEIGRENSLKKTKEQALEHKTSLESVHSKAATIKGGNETRKPSVASDIKEHEKTEKKANSITSEKLESKASLTKKETRGDDKEGKQKEENSNKDKKDKQSDKEAYPSVQIEREEEAGLTDAEPEQKPKEDPFKMKIERIVEEKMEKEVDKLVEQKVQHILKKQEEAKPQYVSVKTKESISDQYLFTTPNPSDYGTNSTLGKHTRFWEIEKRIQDLKDKHHRTFMDQPPQRETSPARSYITSIRERLTSLPPIMSNLSNYDARSLSPTNEDVPVYYAEKMPKQPARVPPKARQNLNESREYRQEYQQEHRKEYRQPERPNRVKSKNLPPPVPQNHKKSREEKQRNTMPRLYETYLGKDFSRNNNQDITPTKSRANSSGKPKLESSQRSRPGEQQVYRLAPTQEDGRGYQIVGYNTRGASQTTDESERVFFTEGHSQKREVEAKKSTNRGYLYGSADMMNSSARSSSRNLAKKNIPSGNNSTSYSRRNISYQSTPQTVGTVRTAAANNNYQNKGSNLLRNNAQFQSVERRTHIIGGPKEKRSSSVIAEVNESNMLSETMNYHGSQGSLKPKRSTSSSKRPSMQRIDSGSLIRQVYRVRGMSRENSHSDIEDHNKTYDVPDRSHLLSGAHGRRKSNDYSFLSTKKGSGFTTAQRTVLINHYESPGPKYDLSSYKSLVGDTKLKVEDYIISKKQSRSPEAKSPTRQDGDSPGKDSQGQMSKKSSKGPIFGTARREILFKYKADTPGPGEYDTPRMQSQNGAPFGRERRSFRGAFSKLVQGK